MGQVQPYVVHAYVGELYVVLRSSNQFHEREQLTGPLISMLIAAVRAGVKFQVSSFPANCSTR